MSKATVSTGETELFDIDTNRERKKMDSGLVAEFLFVVSLAGLLWIMFLVASIFSKDPEILGLVATGSFYLAALAAFGEVVARLVGETRGPIVYAIGACFMVVAIVSTIRLQISRRRLFPGLVGRKT